MNASRAFVGDAGVDVDVGGGGVAVAAAVAVAAEKRSYRNTSQTWPTDRRLSDWMTGGYHKTCHRKFREVHRRGSSS